MSSCIFDYVFDGIPQSTKDYCVQYPLFANLINDTSLHPIRTPGRDAGIDASTFINQTMNTEDTFAACQSFYKSPSPSASTQGDLNLGEFQTFYCLGTGLDGHKGISHGGVLSTMIDHAMGTVARAYPSGAITFTKHMSLDFKKPFRTPAPALCRAWLTRIEGRKMWVSGSIEDAQGESYMTGESLFLMVKPQL